CVDAAEGFAAGRSGDAETIGSERASNHRRLAGLVCDRLLGLPGVDLFSGSRSPACLAGVPQLRPFSERRNGRPWHMDALDRGRPRHRALAELARCLFEMVAPAAGSGLCRGIWLRLRDRALIYHPPLRAVYLLPILSWSN